MDALTSLFLYIPGIVVFLAASGQVKTWLAMQRGVVVNAAVVSCKRVIKKDNLGRETYNFFEVLIEYRDPDSGHAVKTSVKSPTEYGTGQQVKLFREKGSRTFSLVEAQEESAIHPVVMLLGGALLIVLALEQNQGHEIAASAILGILFLGAGLSLLANYIRLKKKGLIPVTATVTEVYTRQLTKRSRFLKSDKFTYYPVVKYELNGVESIRRCHVNVSSETGFKEGEQLMLYYDPATKDLLEKKAKISSCIWGVILAVLGIIVCASVISVILTDL